MAYNKIKGEVELSKLGVLIYDWDALAGLEGEFEKPALEMQERLTEAAVLFSFIKTGLRDKVSDEEIKTHMFPLFATVEVVREALLLAYFGPDDIPKEEPLGNVKPPKKK